MKSMNIMRAFVLTSVLATPAIYAGNAFAALPGCGACVYGAPTPGSHNFVNSSTDCYMCHTATAPAPAPAPVVTTDPAPAPVATTDPASTSGDVIATSSGSAGGSGGKGIGRSKSEEHQSFSRGRSDDHRQLNKYGKSNKS